MKHSDNYVQFNQYKEYRIAAKIKLIEKSFGVSWIIVSTPHLSLPKEQDSEQEVIQIYKIKL